jgi:hypothetical protein
MKRIYVILVVVVFFSGVKPVSGQIDILGSIGDVKDFISSMSTKGTDIANYKTLLEETKNTYVLVEKLFCLKQETMVNINFAKDHLHSCYMSIKYEAYYTTYNSMINQLTAMLTAIESSIIAVTAGEDEGTGSQKLVMDIINLLQNIQNGVSELINLMRGINYQVENAAEAKVKEALTHSGEYEYGRYQIILN